MTLLGRYTVTSAVLAVILAVALGAFVSAQATQAALNEAAATTVQAADSLLSPYLVKGDFVHPLWPARVNNLTRLLRPHLIENGVQHVRLWSRSATIVYSNNPEHIGMQMDAPPEVRRALSGRSAAAIQPGTDGQTLAVYAPVRLVGDVVPSGVYEVNLDAAPLLAHIQASRLRAWLFVFLGTAVLYGSLIGLVFHASRTMLRQQTVLHSAFEGTIQALAAAIDAKDAYTGGHSAEVSQHAQAIARGLRLSPPDIDAVRIAGYLHDLGKIGIRESVLNKQGPLTQDEYEHVKEHVVIGSQILRPLTHLGSIVDFVRGHHEHFDGSGYPDGLSGDKIPMGARIICAAEIYDALTTARPYQPTLPPDEATERMRTLTGKIVDPTVMDALDTAVKRRQTLVFLDEEMPREA